MPIIAPSADTAKPLGYVDANDPQKNRRFSYIATPTINTGTKVVDMDRVAYDDLATTSRAGLMSPQDKALMAPATATRDGYMTAADKALLTPAVAPGPGEPGRTGLMTPAQAALLTPAEGYVDAANPGKNGVMTAGDKGKVEWYLLDVPDPDNPGQTIRVVRADALRGLAGDVWLNDLALKVGGHTRGGTHVVGPVWNTPGVVEYFVDPKLGDDVNGNGTQPRPFATLFRALEFHRKAHPGHVRVLRFSLGAGQVDSPFTASTQSSLGISHDWLSIKGTNDGTTKEAATKTILDGGTSSAILRSIWDIGNLEISNVGLQSSGTAVPLNVQGAHCVLYTSGYLGIVSKDGVSGNGVLIGNGATHFGGGHITFVGDFYNAYSLDNGGSNTGFSSSRTFSHYSGSLSRIICCLYGSTGFFNMGTARFIYGNDSTGDAAIYCDYNSTLYVAGGKACSRTGAFGWNAPRGGLLYPTNLFT